MRKTNAAGLALIKQWEGLRLTSYRDIAGHWTIGYGHTKTASPNQRISEPEATALLKLDLADAEDAVEANITEPLTDNQFAALVSFTFNLGAGALARSTLRKRINEGRLDDVPAELMKWNKARVGGKLVPVKGLTNRRAAEAGLWAKGEHVASRAVAAETGDRSSPVKSTTIQSAIGAGLAGSGAVVTGVSQLDGTAQLVMIVSGVALAGFLAWIMRERLRKWAEGDR